MVGIIDSANFGINWLVVEREMEVAIRIDFERDRAGIDKNSATELVPVTEAIEYYAANSDEAENDRGPKKEGSTVKMHRKKRS